MAAVLAIANLTWLEARRRRIALAALLCGAVFLLVFGIAVYSSYRGAGGIISDPLLAQRMHLQILTLMGLYAVNMLVVALAVMLPVDTISGEIASGVMQTLASKPIRRADIVIGKWTVYWLMIAAYIAFMAGGLVLLMRLITGFHQQHLLPALALMLLEASVMLSVVMAGGVRFTTITNGIIAFAFYGLAFIGGWIEQVGVMLGNVTARYIGTAISLVSPTDSLWRLAMRLLQPPAMSQAMLSPFTPVSVPSPAMVWWSVAFAVGALVLAIRQFEKRAL